MPFNGSGVFTRVYNWVTDKANSVLVTASRMDGEDDGFATGLSNCMTRDGQSPPSTNIPMGGFKLTGLANGSAATDSVAVGQVPSLAGSGSYFDAGNSGAAISIVWANGVNQQLTLTANTTLTLGSGVTPGWYTLKILQDATGGRTITWAGAAYSASRWIGNGAAPVLVGTASGANLIYLFWDGSQWYQLWAGAVARNRVYFTKVSRITSTQVVATGTNAVVVFNSASTDPYSEWNTATGVFTAKVAGTYKIQVNLLLTIVTGGNNIFLEAVCGGTFTNQIFVPTVYNNQVVSYTAVYTGTLAVGGTAYANLINSTAGNAVIGVGSACLVTRLGESQ